MLEARFANPLIYWEVLEDPKAREGAEKPSSWFFQTGLKAQRGTVFESEASRLEIMKAFLGRAGEGSALVCLPPETTCDQ